MKKYDSTLRIISENGKTASIIAGESRRSYSINLGEWPSRRKNNVLLRPSSVTACALCWSINSRCGALRIAATYGKPFDITLPLSTAEVERKLPIFRERAEWMELCTKKTHLSIDLPRGKYAVIDPCYLSGVKMGDSLGTAFDVRPLTSCTGYAWRMFGDGPFVDSGDLCIVPADLVPAEEHESVYGWYAAADRIQFVCVRVDGKPRLNVNIRWGTDKPEASFSNIRPYDAPFISLF